MTGFDAGSPQGKRTPGVPFSCWLPTATHVAETKASSDKFPVRKVIADLSLQLSVRLSQKHTAMPIAISARLVEPREKNSG